MGQQISTPAMPMEEPPPLKFTLFPKLPPELRNKIWEFALPGMCGLCPSAAGKTNFYSNLPKTICMEQLLNLSSSRSTKDHDRVMGLCHRLPQAPTSSSTTAKQIRYPCHSSCLPRLSRDSTETLLPRLQIPPSPNRLFRLQYWYPASCWWVRLKGFYPILRWRIRRSESGIERQETSRWHWIRNCQRSSIFSHKRLRCLAAPDHRVLQLYSFRQSTQWQGFGVRIPSAMGERYIWMDEGSESSKEYSPSVLLQRTSVATAGFCQFWGIWAPWGYFIIANLRRDKACS